MRRLFFVIGALLLIGSEADAYRQGSLQAGMGHGVALNPPVRYDLQLHGEYFILEDLSLGLNADFFLRGPATFLFQGFARYHIDMGRVPRFLPYLGAGIGGSVNENGAGTLDLMTQNFGFRYEAIRDRLFVGPDFSVHIVTNGDASDWDFRILLLLASYRF